jgi:hypothetical protein
LDVSADAKLDRMDVPRLQDLIVCAVRDEFVERPSRIGEEDKSAGEAALPNDPDHGLHVCGCCASRLMCPFECIESLITVGYPGCGAVVEGGSESADAAELLAMRATVDAQMDMLAADAGRLALYAARDMRNAA